LFFVQTIEMDTLIGAAHVIPTVDSVWSVRTPALLKHQTMDISNNLMTWHGRGHEDALRLVKVTFLYLDSEINLHCSLRCCVLNVTGAAPPVKLLVEGKLKLTRIEQVKGFALGREPLPVSTVMVKVEYAARRYSDKATTLVHPSELHPLAPARVTGRLTTIEGSIKVLEVNEGSSLKGWKHLHVVSLSVVCW
jgi:hypothetical protein